MLVSTVRRAGDRRDVPLLARGEQPAETQGALLRSPPTPVTQDAEATERAAGSRWQVTTAIGLRLIGREPSFFRLIAVQSV